MSSVSQAVNVQVSLQTHTLAVGIYDEATSEYVTGNIIIDGVLYPNKYWHVLPYGEEGTHIIDVELPAGTVFVKWEIYNWSEETPRRESTTRPISVTLDQAIRVYAVVRLALIETSLTISAPSSVEPGSTIRFTGKLTRPDTGAGLAGKTFALEHPPGTVIKSGTTDANGNYTITVTAPTVQGTYQYRTSFAGNSVYGSVFSRTLGLGVGALPAWVIPVGVLALTITLIAVSTMKKLF